MEDIKITLYAKVEDEFDLIRFWDAIQGDQMWMRVFNPGYREIPDKTLSHNKEEV